MQRAVFLDRDGVINVEKEYVYRVDDFEFTTEVFSALRALQDARFALLIVTNQSAIGRGFCTEDDFRQLNEWMLARMATEGVLIRGVYHCPHTPHTGCPCRKPAPGMILDAARDHAIDIGGSWIIGDQERDIEAGQRAGVGHSIRIGSRHAVAAERSRASFVCQALPEAVPIIDRCPEGKRPCWS